MNAETKSTAVALSDVHVPAAAMQRGIEPHSWNALKNTIYKGASDQMILLAVDYCKARRLDPLMKPVHIVKTWDSEAGAMVESVWPGINLHRTNGARTQQYAGQDRPAFGPMVKKQLGARLFEFPEWCEVTVYRMVGSERRAFTGLVYFEEAFAQTKDKGPNRMWTKRPRGQLAKCAEAEALRKAFPEETGGDPTAEEMGGTEPGDSARDITPATGTTPAGRLDEMERAIGGSGAMPADETFGLPATDAVDEDGVVTEPLSEEAQKAEAWANDAIARIDKAANAGLIDVWLERNKDRLAKVRAVNEDAAMAVVTAADYRKRQIEGGLP